MFVAELLWLKIIERRKRHTYINVIFFLFWSSLDQWQFSYITDLVWKCQWLGFMCRTNRSSWGASRERERDRDGEDAQNSVNERGWSSLFPSLFSALHSLGARWLSPSRLFGCTLLNLWKWNCCALAEILRQCHITYQNVQHLYIVQLWAEGEMCGWDVAAL